MFTIRKKKTLQEHTEKRRTKKQKIVLCIARRTDLVETLTLKINIHLYKEQESNQVRVISFAFISLIYIHTYIYKEVQGNRRIRSENNV